MILDPGRGRVKFFISETDEPTFSDSISEIRETNFDKKNYSFKL